jgi:hypothetical protein
MRWPCCLCVFVSSLLTFERLNQSVWNSVCITWHLPSFNSLLRKPLPSVCVSMCIPLSSLFNVSVKPLLRNNTRIIGRIVFLYDSCRIKGESVGLSTPLSLIGNGSVNIILWQWKIFRCVVFYAICVVSKESKRLVLPRTFCFFTAYVDRL